MLSSDRLARYRRPSDRHACDTLARYLWNVALCEALYPSLQSAEVALRNGLHRAATHLFQTDFWFDLQTVPFDPFIRREVAAARAALAKRGKDGIRRPVAAGDIVAEVSFGFWTSLTAVQYDRVLWPQAFPVAFPNLAPQQRKRKLLSKRFQDIRTLRNRVFHHEPIWHWSDLRQQHNDLLEAIGWMNGNWCRSLATVDRFPNVLKQGQKPYRSPLRALFPP
jgi:predicted nucleic acid-binding protein